jgi:hypothetical protein
MPDCKLQKKYNSGKAEFRKTTGKVVCTDIKVEGFKETTNDLS